MKFKKGILKLSVKHDKNIDYLDTEVIKEIYGFLKSDQEKCKMLLDIYDMSKQTELIDNAVARTTKVINNWSDSMCKDDPKKKATLKAEMESLSAFSTVNKLIPTNTARNIVDTLVSQLSDDPTPLEIEAKDNEIQLEYIENVMFDSGWELFLNKAFTDLITMGIGAICVKQTEGLASVYLENIPAYQCAFVMQGGNVKYSYFRSDEQLIVYTDTQVIEYEADEDSFKIVSTIDVKGGAPYLQPLVFPKNKGVFQTCLSDIAIYDMALYVATHDLADPKASIFNTHASTQSVGWDSSAELSNNPLGTRTSYWITKPSADKIALCKYTRETALENIIDDTNIVTEKMLTTVMNTATQSMEVISKMNSLIKSTGNMFQQRMYPVLRILENLAIGLDGIKININVTFQEISNTYQKLELAKGSLPLKEEYRMLGYNRAEERDELYKEYMQQVSDKADAEMGTQSTEKIPDDTTEEENTTEIVEVDENAEQ